MKTDLYLASIAQELRAVADRVRFLIGDVHWLTDGHHREAVLAGTLKRHLPSNVVLARGFVLGRMEDQRCSKEQDILIVDQSLSAPLFYEHGVAISSPENVFASIAVKSTFSLDAIRDGLRGAQSVLDTISRFHNVDPILFATFFFNGEPPSQSTLQRAATEMAGQGLMNSDRLRWGPGIEYLAVCITGEVIQLVRSDRRIATVYRCDHLSSAVLIARLAQHIGSRRPSTGVVESFSRLDQLIFDPLYQYNSSD